MLHIRMSHGAHIDESWSVEWVMLQKWTSHVRQGACVHHKIKSFLDLEAFHTYEWVMSQSWMSLVTQGTCVHHRMNRLFHLQTLLRMTRVMLQSCCSHVAVMLHVWMSHGPEMDTSHIFTSSLFYECRTYALMRGSFSRATWGIHMCDMSAIIIHMRSETYGTHTNVCMSHSHVRHNS